MKIEKSTVISFLMGGVVCLTACLSIGSEDSLRVLRQKPVISSVTMTPEIPDKVSFCGQTIDLRRYNMHEGFDREISTFTYLHATTMLYIKRANRYFPIIEPILKANGIPDDLKYLAVIESNLDPRIKSPAGALGMWQLMSATAKEQGLVITPTVDERCHVEKATEAACRYMKAAYAKYGDWAAVASSYNAGMGRISGELNKQDADNTFDLWLVEETTRYVYRIMAIKQIFEHPYKYGFVMQPRDLYRPIACKEVTVSSDVPDLSAFAKSHGVTYADLKRFNPWLRDRKLQTGGKQFTLKIPLEQELYYTSENTYVHNPNWIVK
ncbi:MAG: lytic transglycosylase domain-containing protein [Parabacteroides sp.]